ncbi:MAG: hypothetical protein HY529_01150 [Chloroflexi bacterium]|nr:hypothetical protein [Chloroflexota bacterium]
MAWLTPIRELLSFTFPIIERLPVVRAILGFILVFLLPGLTWTLIFFRQINIIERVALSLGLSIVVVTLSLLFTSRLFGMSITGANSVLVILTVTILPVFVYYLNKLIKRSKTKAT